VKHASAAALAKLADLLGQIRARDGIRERRPGVFYRQSQAFLHFHEDPSGLFADLRIGGDFDRSPVNTADERQALLASIDRLLTG